MKIRKILTLLIIALVTTSAAFAQDKAEKIDELLKAYHDYRQLNGAVLIAENGRVIYKKGFGMANFEWNIPNRPDTKFRIGSVTKQFTAALILQLVEEGKVKLDGKITDYLPDYRKDTGDKVTIHHLLNHTSGIPSYTALPGFFQNESRNPYEVDEFIKKFASHDLEFEPGERFSYNNSGYFLLGAIIEKVTGKSYAKVLKERILEPLGMNDTGYDEHGAIIERRARGYDKTPTGFTNARYLDMSLPYAAGAMYSTVEDLYKWDQALYGDKILSAESKKLMFKPGLEEYGYGFRIVSVPVGKTDRKVKIIQHGGGINGFNSLITRVVDQKHLVVILDNISEGRYHGPITSSIINILNGEAPVQPKKSIAETLYQTATEKGGAAAVARYRKLKTEEPEKYDFAERELNNLGYQLLNRDKVRDAIEIFKLNVEMFPEAFNPYDSLGEAYLRAGEQKLALENYKKSVELNPNNVNGVRAIKKIEGSEEKVDPNIFDAYVGDYELAPNFILTVTREGDKLMGQATGQGKLELEPVTEMQFVVPGVNANITFEKDSAGKVTGLVLDQRGQKINAKKIN